MEFIERVKIYIAHIYEINNWIPMMNFWIMSLFIWLVIDIIRYIYYVLTYRKLNTANEQRDTNHSNIKKILTDLNNYPDIFEDLINDLFYNRVRMEDMNFEDVCMSIYEMIGEYEEYIVYIKKLVKKFQLRQQTLGKQVFVSNVHHKRVRHRKHDIIAWFNILPIYLITRTGSVLVTIYMRTIGYKCYKFKNGLKIWYNKYDQKKGSPLVFFHASVGGVTVQVASLGHFSNKHNIIMPEIPGVSFVDTHDKPPAISEIIENVHEFILKYYIDEYSEYIVDSSKLKINLMGHSLGCTICSAYINKYPKHIDSFFCVEGQIFFPRAIRLCEDFITKIEDIPTEDLISVPLFHRDLYVQYFIIKRLTLDSTMIFDLSNEDNKHIKIHMYHIKDDRRLLIHPQLVYATRKNIKLIYHLFEGEYSHGSFALNNKIRKYVMNNIQKVYDDQNYLKKEILTRKPSIEDKICMDLNLNHRIDDKDINISIISNQIQ